MSSGDELPGMPPVVEDTPLGKAAMTYVDHKEAVAREKIKQDDAEKIVFEEMDKAGVPSFKISVGGENYEFDVKNSERKLSCVKITKTAKKSEPAKEKPEPATV